MTVEDQDPIALTRRWLERAVIGLNLCPFAKAVHAKGLIRFVLSEATTPEVLLEELVAELASLRDADPQTTDTTLLIHPQVLNDFIDYNDFLDAADAAIEALDLGGVLQVASFHPDYQFAGTAPDDIGNYSNRSPFPTLHLLREASVSRAADTLPDADGIVDRNLATLEKLGHHAWRELLSKDG
ncbi:MAG: DUF1415 domain-containing protein [Luteimonas sp.]|nr:DUF1415 domain-containing protein [Luteimonas sp.]